MKYFFLTLDLEEWYHLDYLKQFKFKKKDFFVNSLNLFFDLLDSYQIKITVFVLAEIAEKYPELIKNISDKGHEIACHGFDHELLYNKTNEQFRNEVSNAKNILEAITGKKVKGYRASCYSMTRDKLEILMDLGFIYDSSYIKFSQHALYKQFDISDFENIENLVYKKNNFYEFEIPTLRISKYDIPISGGGYFRLLPKLVYSYLFSKFRKNNNNFIFYIHPFEVVPKNFNIKNVGFKNIFRFGIGRKTALKKLEFYINKWRTNYTFKTINDYISEV